MSERICLVTGANSGIGRAAAMALARRGATVVLACRDPGRAEDTRAEIAATGADVSVVLFDLGSRAQIHRATEQLKSRLPRLDVLVNSAGRTYLNPASTVDGLDAAFGVNVLGPFLLTTLLQPLLGRSRSARIVDLAGRSHRREVVDADDLFFFRRGYDAWAVANAAQAARVMLVEEWARRLPEHITINAVHPGAVLTAAQGDLPWPLRLLIYTVLRPGFVRPEQGAEPVVRLSTAAHLEGVTGRFFNRSRPEATDYDPVVTGALWQRCCDLAGLADPVPGCTVPGSADPIPLRRA